MYDSSVEINSIWTRLRYLYSFKGSFILFFCFAICRNAWTFRMARNRTMFFLYFLLARTSLHIAWTITAAFLLLLISSALCSIFPKNATFNKIINKIRIIVKKKNSKKAKIVKNLKRG